MTAFVTGHKKTVAALVLFVMLASLACACAGPLWDIDLWWHLATGKYIVEHRQLPASDPFCYPSQPPPETYMQVLNGYWLAQIFFFFAYAAAGNFGLIALRVILIVSSLLSIYFIARRLGADGPSAFIVLALAGCVATNFTGGRPQLFSFLLAPPAVYLLEYLKRKFSRMEEVSWRGYVPAFLSLPALMLVWANLHGGFVMGAALIALFLMSEGAGTLFGKRAGRRPFLLLCGAGLAAMAATLLNPNTFGTYLLVAGFQGSHLQRVTSEYLSPVTLMLRFRTFVTPYWIYLAAAAIVWGASFKAVDGTHVFVALFLAAVSLTAFRYIPFFVYVTAPMTAVLLTRVTDGMKGRKGMRAGFVALALSLSLFVFIAGFPRSLGATLRHTIAPYRFPEAAASFIRDHSPSGNIFNHLNGGGYLIWTLFPSYKVFIDGRMVDRGTVFRDYTRILWDRSESPRLLDRYGVNIVVMPALNPLTGELYELVNMLQADDRWNLVVSDEATLVFLRGEENRGIIGRFSLPKGEVGTHVIREALHLLGSGVNTPHVWRALGAAYLKKGLMNEADRAFRNASILNGDGARRR